MVYRLKKDLPDEHFSGQLRKGFWDDRKIYFNGISTDDTPTSRIKGESIELCLPYMPMPEHFIGKDVSMKTEFCEYAGEKAFESRHNVRLAGATGGSLQEVEKDVFKGMFYRTVFGNMYFGGFTKSNDRHENKEYVSFTVGDITIPKEYLSKDIVLTKELHSGFRAEEIEIRLRVEMQNKTKK